MAFIRKKIVRGRPYYYIVENKLVNGKVKQKILFYIGTANNLLKKLKIKH